MLKSIHFLLSWLVHSCLFNLLGNRCLSSKDRNSFLDSGKSSFPSVFPNEIDLHITPGPKVDTMLIKKEPVTVYPELDHAAAVSEGELDLIS